MPHRVGGTRARVEPRLEQPLELPPRVTDDGTLTRLAGDGLEHQGSRLARDDPRWEGTGPSVSGSAGDADKAGGRSPQRELGDGRGSHVTQELAAIDARIGGGHQPGQPSVTREASHRAPGVDRGREKNRQLERAPVVHGLVLKP